MVNDHRGTGEAVEEEKGGGDVSSSFILSFTKIHDLNDTKLAGSLPRLSLRAGICTYTYKYILYIYSV